jgi:hypothetical protein
MKADESADYAGSCEIRFPTKLRFFFVWGLEIVKCISKNLDFGWGQIQ